MALDPVVEQLQDQNADQYKRLAALEKSNARIWGDGDDTGTLSGRLRAVEDDMGEIQNWMAEERGARAQRQCQVDKFNRRLIAVISVVGLLVAAAALVPVLA